MVWYPLHFVFPDSFDYRRKPPPGGESLFMDVQKFLRKNRKLLTGIGLILVGLAGPLVLNVKTFGVLQSLQSALSGASSTHIVSASVKLVLLNTIRALPIYLGAFVLVEGLLPKRRFLTDAMVPTVLIVAIYYLIQFIHGIKYDFRAPALIQIVCIAVILRMDSASRGMINKTVILGQLLFGLQWLDIAPALTAFGFGHGELSIDIKMSAVLLESGGTLNLLAAILCAAMVANALLTGKFMIDYSRHIQLVEADRENRVAFERMQTEAMRARQTLETQALVHDLKTPLTTIVGLTSVLETTAVDELSRRYLPKIAEYCERMDSLVSQVLSGDVREMIAGEELMRRLSAHLPDEKTRGRVQFHSTAPLPFVKVNAVRMVRALANLVNNAVWAVGESHPFDGKGLVDVRFFPGQDGASLVVTVRDNGPGIAALEQDRVWEAGFSRRGSSGLGLTFARQVICENRGIITLESAPAEGTVCRVEIPGPEEANAS